MRHRPSSTIRTRRIKWFNEADSHGTGRVRMIQYVKLIAYDLYQGRLRDGSAYFVTGARIRAKPKMYRLRKEHAGCYRLVITQVEKHRGLESAVERMCGPMQRDIGNRVRMLYHLCNGKTFTDMALKYKENIRESNVVEVGDYDFKARMYSLTSTAVSPLLSSSTPSIEGGSQEEPRELRVSIELSAYLVVNV